MSGRCSLTQVSASSPEALAAFLPSILTGLSKSNRPDARASVVTDQIGRGAHLPQVAHYLRFADRTDPNWLSDLLDRAIASADTAATIYAVAACVARRDLHAKDTIDRIFIPGLSALTAREDTLWLNHAWFQPTTKENDNVWTQDTTWVHLVGAGG